MLSVLVCAEQALAAKPMSVDDSKTSRPEASKANGRNPASPLADSSQIIGEGEMADLIRAFDWDTTPLGPVLSWPDLLVTTVNLMLASRHPMFLFWGPDYIQFYNDGYRPSIQGGKHPTALGQKGIECWPEIWTVIGPQIESVMHHGKSTWHANQLLPIFRNGRLEEVFWTYSYSPVRDRNGVVQATLVVCSETTDQVLSERRLRTVLATEADTTADGPALGDAPLLTLARSIVAKLESNPADLPFAALFLIKNEKVFYSASTAGTPVVTDAGRWPWAATAKSQTPILLEDVRQRCGDLLLPPWHEHVARAFVLPLPLPRSEVRAVLVLGASPRLPFDAGYQTFCRLVGARIAAQLESRLQRLEIAAATNTLESRVADRTAALQAEIVDRKWAETQLRSLTGQLLSAQDDERRHLARELHDHAGQTLVALGMNLAALREGLAGQSAELVEFVEQSESLSENLSREIRTLSYLLHPPLLEEAGLSSALRWYVDGFSERSKISVTLDITEHFQRLPHPLELTLFRVVQESLTNVHRHSGSLQASIGLEASDDWVRLEISDTGKGITRERLQAMSTAQVGVGVRGMEERVRQFGGVLAIESTHAGTTVRVEIPRPSE